MTREQIIAGLDCMSRYTCDGCPNYTDRNCPEVMTPEIAKAALELLTPAAPTHDTDDNDLISRAAAIEALGERPHNWTDSEAEIAEVCAWEIHKSAIENINAVDAIPVEWIEDRLAKMLKGKACGFVECATIQALLVSWENHKIHLQAKMEREAR